MSTQLPPPTFSLSPTLIICAVYANGKLSIMITIYRISLNAPLSLACNCTFDRLGLVVSIQLSDQDMSGSNTFTCCVIKKTLKIVPTNALLRAEKNKAAKGHSKLRKKAGWLSLAVIVKKSHI